MTQYTIKTFWTIAWNCCKLWNHAEPLNVFSSRSFLWRFSCIVYIAHYYRLLRPTYMRNGYIPEEHCLRMAGSYEKCATLKWVKAHHIELKVKWGASPFVTIQPMAAMSTCKQSHTFINVDNVGLYYYHTVITVSAQSGCSWGRTQSNTLIQFTGVLKNPVVMIIILYWLTLFRAYILTETIF